MGYFQVPQISQIYTDFFLCLSIIKKRFNSKPMELNLFFMIDRLRKNLCKSVKSVGLNIFNLRD